MGAFHTIETPTNAVGAVTILRIVSDDLDGVLAKLTIKPIAVGQIRLAQVLGLDDALVARFDERSLFIMPHGGIGITRALSKALSGLGIELLNQIEPQVVFPEAKDIHEARMLMALAIAPSPMAVDVLLDQPRRWRKAKESEPILDASVLNRLLTPPVVVAVGRANIGKSSLVNTLAGTSVAMVSGTAGTTRDHVGVMLDLGGLAVRWVDTPGIDEHVVVGEELELVGPVIQAADLIVHVIDQADLIGELDPRLAEMIPPSSQILRIGVRSDLGSSSVQVDCWCSSKSGDGVETIATTIKNRLIPPEVLASPYAWQFWES